MKVLSLMQPFAWAVMQGIKDVENRSRRTLHRGPLLIHSSRKWFDTPKLADGTKPPPPEQLVFGAILGQVELVDCVPLEQAPKSPFVSGPWCWVFAHPIGFSEPIEATGQVGLWNSPVGDADCDHCQTPNEVEIGQTRCLCHKCKKWFSVEW